MQVVEVLSSEDNLGGSFELNLGTIPQKITVHVDESDRFNNKTTIVIWGWSCACGIGCLF